LKRNIVAKTATVLALAAGAVGVSQSPAEAGVWAKKWGVPYEYRFSYYETKGFADLTAKDLSLKGNKLIPGFGTFTALNMINAKLSAQSALRERKCLAVAAWGTSFRSVPCA
jgi:hypothetical protein